MMGVSFFSFSFSIVSLSSRRSSLVPTRMMGVLGQWCLTSGYHWGGKRVSGSDGWKPTRKILKNALKLRGKWEHFSQGWRRPRYESRNGRPTATQPSHKTTAAQCSASPGLSYFDSGTHSGFIQPFLPSAHDMCTNGIEISISNTSINRSVSSNRMMWWRDSH